MKNNNQNISVIDAKEFDVFSANFIKEKFDKLSNKQVINVALSGGSTPLPILNILKNLNLSWENFNFFLVDERVVDVNSNQSNYKNINEVFYQYISSKSYPVLQENLSLDETVLVYKKHIQRNVDFINPAQPKFDIIILGMGEDGHTASLFPNTSALKENETFFVKNYVSQLDSNRVTLTFPALLSCDELIVLIKGEKKIKVFDEVISGKGEKYPISKLLSLKVNWIIGK